LKSYATQRGLDPNNAFSHVIFFYGKCSIPKPFAITGAEMDEHFSWPVYEPVDEVNKYFQTRLFSILARSAISPRAVVHFRNVPTADGPRR